MSGSIHGSSCLPATQTGSPWIHHGWSVQFGARTYDGERWCDRCVKRQTRGKTIQRLRRSHAACTLCLLRSPCCACFLHGMARLESPSLPLKIRTQQQYSDARAKSSHPQTLPSARAETQRAERDRHFYPFWMELRLSSLLRSRQQAQGTDTCRSSGG